MSSTSIPEISDLMDTSQIIISYDDGSLRIDHYKECDESSPDWIKATRGVIKELETGKKVCETFGYTPEYNVSNQIWREKWNGGNKYFRSEEGTLLRMFFWNHRWYLSTHKRIDAFGSRWSSNVSFGESFLEGLEYYFLEGEGVGKLEFEERADLYDRFCATLDQTCVYTFLVRTTSETRIVCKSPLHPTVYFAGYFHNGARLEGNPTLLPFPFQISFTTPDELENYVRSLNPFHHQGVIVFTPDQKVFKIMNDDYVEYAKVRGCEPNIQLAYLRIRECTELIEKFMKIFPDKKMMMNYVEEHIVKLAQHLHLCYAKRFIYKEYIVVNQHYFYMMRLAHTWHNQNRGQNIVTVQKFLELLDKQNPHFLYVLLSQ